MEKKIVSDVQILEFAIYDGDETMVIGKDITETKAAEQLSCSPELLVVMMDNFDVLKEAVHYELVSLYKKIG